VKIFNWLGTIYGGKLHMTTAMYFAIGFVAMFLIGGLNGAALAIVPFDYQVTDTYFVVSHIHYVLFGGAALGIFAALFYWFPKFSGKYLNETLGKIQFWIVIIGLNLAFFPMHILGLLGMPRRIYTYASNGQWDSLNLLSTVGAFIIAVGVALFVVNFFMSMIRGQKAPDDPWDAFTLEWMTTSPPAVYNFETIPTVRSRRPFYDVKHPDNPDWKRRSH
jgi:cytochrome c oxidase subunit 1